MSKDKKIEKKVESQLIQLLHIFSGVMFANKEVESKEGLRGLYAEKLAVKFFGHVVSALYLFRGISIPELLMPKNHSLEFSSVHTLVRAALESFLVFYYIFIDSSDKDKADLRYRAWELAGLYQRQKFKNPSKEYIELLNQDLKLIKHLEEEIENNSIFQSFNEKKKEKIFKKLRKNNWRSKSWVKIALSAGFSETNSETVYGFLCEHAHSGSMSASQINQADNSQKKRELMMMDIGYLLICTANMIKCCCSYFPKSGEYYTKNHQEPNVVTGWIKIGQEA